jgi:glycosyltransferase involved in cell wall biosynthesis
VGPNDQAGIGSLGRDLVVNLAVDRWLVSPTSDPAAPPIGMTTHIQSAPPGVAPEAIRAWAQGLDWVIFAESPTLPGLVWRAREMGAGVACIPMWEWTHPDAEWLAGVDLMICPTVRAFERLLAIKQSRGYAWELTHVAWPVDVNRFAFRPRGTCRRFLYVNGRGGCLGRRADGSTTPYRRKGLDVVLSAAARLSDVDARFLIRSQAPIGGPLPKNVTVLPPVSRNERLYDDGDVCVQPSRWEGIGLSLLESQAAGMPLVTTNAPPMNEFAPFRAVEADSVETVYLEGDLPVDARHVDPDRLAETLRELVGADLSEASREARRFVEQRHDWRLAAAWIGSALRFAPSWR